MCFGNPQPCKGCYRFIRRNAPDYPFYLDRQLAILANHIPNRYMLSFRPTSDRAGFHALVVRIPSQPALQVAARTSYWLMAAPGR